MEPTIKKDKGYTTMKPTTKPVKKPKNKKDKEPKTHEVMIKEAKGQ